jgi:chorismate mutase
LHSCCRMKVRSQLEACLRWMVDIHVNKPSYQKCQAAAAMECV